MTIESWFSPRSSTVEYLLDKFRYEIPVYQRDYSWEEDQVEALWVDVINQIEKNYTNGQKNPEQIPHFFGAIVLETIPDEINKCIIIDGQQRLVTVSLLCSTLIEFILRIDDDQKKSTLISTVLPKYALRGEGNNRLPRIQLGNEHNFYKEFIVEKDTFVEKEKVFNELSTRQKTPVIQRLYNNAKYFNDKVSGYLSGPDDTYLTKISSMIDVLFSTFVNLQIVVENQGAAYTIFETLNERGLDLAPADLIKNEALRLSEQQGKLVESNELWREMVSALPDGKDPITGYLRYQYSSKHSSVEPKELYYKISDYLRNLKTPVVGYMKEVREESEYYANLHEPDISWTEKTRNALMDIKSLKITHAYPLLIAASVKYSTDNQKYERIVCAVRDFCFRFFTISRNRVSKLELIIGEVARKLRAGKYSLDDAIKALKKESSDKVFTEDFENYIARDTKIAFFVLKNIEDHLAGGQGVTVLPHSPNQHIEHVMPKKPGLEWGHVSDNELYEKYVNRLGNLLVLEKDINKHINNKGYDYKINNIQQKDYQNSVLKLPKETSNYLNDGLWNLESIKKRQQKIVKEYALLLWPLS